MTSKSSESNKLVMVGHPFATIGMGEHIRCTCRALSAVVYPYNIRDIYAIDKRNDPGLEKEFADKLVNSLSSGINIFHINGDEVEQALAHMRSYIKPGAYNIIYPVWELSKYPSEWVKYLDKFDEIWAPSKFVCDTFTKAVSRTVYHMSLPVEAKIDFYLPRRYFSLPESSYLFLFYFDFRSYIARKNPFGILKAFEKLLSLRPEEDIRLVLKRINSTGKIIIINKILTDNETKNLVRCCDCFVSLHRSEGFGRGTAEAMYLGKPVIATGYSGNMDFMNKDNSFILDYNLVRVNEGEYPFADGQLWADANIEQAVNYMLRLIDDQEYGMEIGKIASRHMRTYFSYRAAGLRYANRIDEIGR